MENTVRRTVTMSGICEFVLFPWTLSTRLLLRCVKSLVMLTRFLATHADVFRAGNSLIENEKHCLVTFFGKSKKVTKKKTSLQYIQCLADLKSLSKTPAFPNQCFIDALVVSSSFYCIWQAIDLNTCWSLPSSIFIWTLYSISQGKKDEGWLQVHTKLRAALMFRISQINSVEQHVLKMYMTCVCSFNAKDGSVSISIKSYSQPVEHLNTITLPKLHLKYVGLRIHFPAFYKHS